MGVDLRRYEALVAQQFLHAAYIGPAIQQVRGEAMAQCVRRCSRSARRFDIFFENRPTLRVVSRVPNLFENKALRAGFSRADKSAFLASP